MKLKELIHYRPGPGPDTLQRSSLRLLAGFLALMLLCTLLSRAADSLTVARVETEAPQRSSITHTVRADGRLEADSQLAVTALPDVLVGSLAVGEGAAVKTGDLLFTLDMDDLNGQLLQKQLELQRLYLSLTQQNESAALAQQKGELDAQRAQEDYELAMEKARLKLRQAGEDRRLARQALRDYTDENDVDDDEDDDNLDPEYRALKNEYRAAQRAYEDAAAAQQESIIAAERAVEDLKYRADSSEAAVIQVDIRLKQLEIAKLQAAIEAEGQVSSPADAVVTELGVRVGRRTTSEAAVLLTERSSGLRFVAEVADEDREYLAGGDPLSLKLAGVARPVQGVRIGGLKALADRDGYSRLTAQLPAGVGELGQAAVMTAEKKTEPYPCCVPAAALRKDGEQYYVLAVRERETTLGVERYAERVNVTVEEQNETRAAVTGPLDQDDEIIVSASRQVADGDRVRAS